MALQVGAARVERAGALGGERRDRRLERAWWLSGTVTFQPPQPANSQAGSARAIGPLVQELVAEAHGGAVEPVGALEDVHLAAPDDGDRAGDDGHAAVVEQVLAGARARPDQLVVVVAVRLADDVAVAADVETVEQHDLDGVVAVREAVDGQPAPAGADAAQDAHARGVAWRPPSGL